MRTHTVHISTPDVLIWDGEAAHFVFVGSSNSVNVQLNIVVIRVSKEHLGMYKMTPS